MNVLQDSLRIQIGKVTHDQVSEELEETLKRTPLLARYSNHILSNKLGSSRVSSRLSGHDERCSVGLSLKRKIGTFEATSFGVGTILGAGIYALIGPAAGVAGNAVWVSFIVGALISSFTGLSYAELSTMFPKAAAEYMYAKKAFGTEFGAFLLGWRIIFANDGDDNPVVINFQNWNLATVPEFLKKMPQYQQVKQIMAEANAALSIKDIAEKMSVLNGKEIKEQHVTVVVTRYNKLFTKVGDTCKWGLKYYE